MAAYFIDLDGTTFYWGVNEFVPNARQTLQKWVARGDQIIFTTRRPSRGNEALGPMFDEILGRGNYSIIFGIDSPRTLINDDGAAAINHPRDSAWAYP